MVELCLSVSEGRQCAVIVEFDLAKLAFRFDHGGEVIAAGLVANAGCLDTGSRRRDQPLRVESNDVMSLVAL